MSENFYTILITLSIYIGFTIITMVLLRIYKAIKTIYLNRKLRKMSTLMGLSYAKHKKTFPLKIENGFLVGDKNGRYIEIVKHDSNSPIKFIQSLYKPIHIATSYWFNAKCNYNNVRYKIIKNHELEDNISESIVRINDSIFNGFYVVKGSNQASVNHILGASVRRFLISHYHNINGLIILENGFLKIQDTGKTRDLSKNFDFMSNLALQTAEKIEASIQASPLPSLRNKVKNNVL